MPLCLNQVLDEIWIPPEPGFCQASVNADPSAGHKKLREKEIYDTSSRDKEGTENGIPNQTHSLMNYIIWNVRGGNNTKFKRHFSTMVQLHKSAMLVLLETRMANHKKLTEELYFDMLI